MIVNPVYFNNLFYLGRYILNPNFVLNLRLVNHQRLKAYTTCTFVVHGKNEQIATFYCEKKDHLTRMCRIVPLIIPEKEFNTPMKGAERFDTRGSIFLPLSRGVCHACGEESNRAVENWAGHLVCSGCLIAKKSNPPFMYGKGKNICCDTQKCGQQPGSKEDQENNSIYKRAISIVRTKRIYNR